MDFLSCSMHSKEVGRHLSNLLRGGSGGLFVKHIWLHLSLHQPQSRLTLLDQWEPPGWLSGGRHSTIVQSGYVVIAAYLYQILQI